MRIIGAFVLSLVITFSVVSPVATADTAQGVVKSIQGLVRLKPSGVETWKKAKKGDPVRDGDIVRTMEDAKVQLVMKDGGIVTIGPLATLEIRDPRMVEAAAAGGVKARLKLLLGSILARVSKQKAGSEFAIETPVAVASVKGTAFGISMGKAGMMNLLVLEGMVKISNSRGIQEVNGGQMSSCQSGKPPAKPSNFDPNKAPAWISGLVGPDKEDKFIRAVIKDKDGVEREVILKYSNK